jgi:hypothetical protein
MQHGNFEGGDVCRIGLREMIQSTAVAGLDGCRRP